MADSQEVKITDFDVKEINEIRTSLRISTSPAGIGWGRMFKDQYRQDGFIVDDAIAFEGSQIVLRTQATVNAGLRKKIERVVENTNRAWREKMGEKARVEAETETRERRAAEEKSQREAELKRKLLEEDS